MRISDWSSDVCSSDLRLVSGGTVEIDELAIGTFDHRPIPAPVGQPLDVAGAVAAQRAIPSDHPRRVIRSRGWRIHRTLHSAPTKIRRPCSPPLLLRGAV